METTQAATTNPRKSINITFDFDGFKYAENGDVFDNDYDFFYTFVMQFGNRPIESYLQTKTRRGKTYQTARFPEQDKTNMKRALKKLLNFEVEKVNTKTTQYVIHSVNQEAVALEMEKAKWKLERAVALEMEKTERKLGRSA
jgi:ribosomal protein L23